MTFLIALAALSAPIACPDPRALDGDTIACGTARIRLSGIDSPELPGHCRKGRDCAPGDPFAAKTSLEEALASGPVTYRAIKVDLYGRTVGIVFAGAVNLNCLQLAKTDTRYVEKWDTGHFVRDQCGMGK